MEAGQANLNRSDDNPTMGIENSGNKVPVNSLPGGILTRQQDREALSLEITLLDNNVTEVLKILD